MHKRRATIPKQGKSRGSVFISHASADQELARDLAEELRRASFEPWLLEEALQPGENWAKMHGRALETSDSIVVLVSKNSIRSAETQRDWDFAISSMRHAGRVLPVFTPGTSIESAPWILKHLQHVRGAADWRKTTRAVVAALRKLSKSA